MPNKTKDKIKKIIENALMLIFAAGGSYRRTDDQDAEVIDPNSHKGRIRDVVDKIAGLYIPLLTGSFEKSSSPLLAYADSALENGNETTEGILEMLREVMDVLPWEYSYDERSDAPGLGARIGWAELIGPKAPFQSDKFCLGFTLIAPDTLYPQHNHPATELYYVLSGTANWTLDGKTSAKTPGEVILHPSLHSHSMETGSEALLALYLWVGEDIVTLSQYTGEDSTAALVGEA